MLDPKLLRSNPEGVAQQLKLKRYHFDVERFLQLEAQRKTLQVQTEHLQSERNRLSKTIGIAKQQNQNVDALLADVQNIMQQYEKTSQLFQTVTSELDQFCASIPNIPHSSVPSGNSEEENVEVRKVGDIPSFSFVPRDHVALTARHNAMDLAAAAKITGSRFVVLRGKLARLQRALIQLMLDTHTKEHGYQEMYVPYLVNRQSLFGTGQLPKFEEDQFFCVGPPDYALIPTAEVSLTNLVRDSILDMEELPLRFVTHTPCFRREAGSYGKDMQGMFRQHQFEKVELVQIVLPEHSSLAHEALTQHAEAILQKLELPYRVVVLCGGDLGFAAAKTYDLEVWLPGQNRYREISSCSNFDAFQARRMQARFRNVATQNTEWVHTINGSGLAVGRTLIAILENFQDEVGNIHLPQALHPYMDNEKILHLN